MKNDDTNKAWEDEIFQLILGELTAEEADKLHAFLAEDEDAMNFYLDMQEVVARSRDEAVYQKEDLKLADDQHKKLFAMAGFLTNATATKTESSNDSLDPVGASLAGAQVGNDCDVNPAETAELPKKETPVLQTGFAKSFIQVAAAVFIVGLPLSMMVMPSLAKSRSKALETQRRNMAKMEAFEREEIELYEEAPMSMADEASEEDFRVSGGARGRLFRRDGGEADYAESADDLPTERIYTGNVQVPQKALAQKESKKRQRRSALPSSLVKQEKRKAKKNSTYGTMPGNVEVDAVIGDVALNEFASVIEDEKNLGALNTPKVTIQSGAEASISIVQERSFDEDFEAPEIVYNSDILSDPLVSAKSGKTSKARRLTEKLKSDRYKITVDKKANKLLGIEAQKGMSYATQADMSKLSGSLDLKDDEKKLSEEVFNRTVKTPILGGRNKKPANRDTQIKQALEKAKVLYGEKNYDQAKREVQQVFILDYANKDAHKIARQITGQEGKKAKLRRIKSRSETAWKWADSVKGKTEEAKKKKLNLSQTSYQLSDELYSYLKSTDKEKARKKLSAYNIQLDANSEVQFNDAFNNVIISNTDDNRTQNGPRIEVLEKGIVQLKQQKEAQALYRQAENLYLNDRDQEAQILLHQAMKKHSSGEMIKLLLKVNAELAKSNEVTADKLLKLTAKDPLSTFSIDVDTASYTQARNQLNSGQAVRPSSIRSEEFVNYFDYKYQAPKDKDFSILSQLAPSEFHRGSQILRLAVQSKRPGSDLKRPSAFTFVIDTSGSMGEHNRLPLIRKVLPMILKQMKGQDRVTIITGNLKTHLLLDRVNVKNKTRIMPIIEGLQAGGPTDLEEMLLEAYDHAGDNYVAGAYNRVVLISDGVANLGETAAQKILGKLKETREKGIALTVVGMGRSQYNDPFLETLANKGDGNYVFIDSEEEARKAFVEKFSGIFHLVAKDVKIQVEFNPAKVLKYRQIGYDNRQLRHQDFRNDKVDAGEVGSGQSVTALYEVVLADQATGDLGEVRLRYKDPHNNDAVTEMKQAIAQTDRRPTYAQADANYQLAVLTGQFAECLKGGVAQRGVQIEDILKKMRPLAARLSYDASVQELLTLMEKAK